MENEVEHLLRQLAEWSIAYLDGVGERRVAADAAPLALSGLPEIGAGDAEAVERLRALAEERSVASVGPRFFHWVVGGVTPAALAADWLTSAVDQVASSTTGSPLGVDLEEQAMRWLAELFDLDSGAWTGALTTGATTANFVGLGAARQWVGEAHGVDVAQTGLAGLPRIPVLSSGFVHASVEKALAMLGLGRDACERFARDNRGTLDVEALGARLASLEGAPAIVVATAGEVNSGRFDPIDELADLCAEHGAWLHVDGAFGLFARVTPRVRALANGVERADSIASDAHKWLNVPYDCGFVLARERALLAKTFRLAAPYLPSSAAGSAPVSVPANLVPECSRRARALPVFATLLASGRAGVREMVERHLDLAEHLRARIAASEDLELVDDGALNDVPFRLAPAGVRRRDLDALNAEAGRRVLADGRVYVGTTRYR
ncbi:MAG: pyridoxal-dependent decarboxylase, partial [Planctomycetota bacterium]